MALKHHNASGLFGKQSLPIFLHAKAENCKYKTCIIPEEIFLSVLELADIHTDGSVNWLKQKFNKILQLCF